MPKTMTEYSRILLHFRRLNSVSSIFKLLTFGGKTSQAVNINGVTVEHALFSTMTGRSRWGRRAKDPNLTLMQ